MRKIWILGSLSLAIILQFTSCSSVAYSDDGTLQNKKNKTEINLNSIEAKKTITPQVKPTAIANINKTKNIIKITTSKLMKFSADKSFDPDGNDTTLSYQWSNINANTMSNKKSFVHKYDKKGLYEATLKVTDEQKLTAIDRICILVDLNENEIPLIAKAGKDQKVGTNQKINLTGRAICRNDISKYEWRNGGKILSTQAHFKNSFKVGKHTLTFTIEDDKGNKAIDTVIVTVI